MKDINWKGLVYEMDNAFRRIGTNTDKLERAGHYSYIPLDYGTFLNQLNKAAKELGLDFQGAKFVDAGCGIGTKVAMAGMLGLDAYGVELNPDYVRVAQRMVGYGSDHVIEGDAIKHNYKPYDIIYFYRPMRDERMQSQLEQRIVRTAQSGAIILANGKNSHREPWRSGKLVEELHWNIVYRKR